MVVEFLHEPLGCYTIVVIVAGKRIEGLGKFLQMGITNFLIDLPQNAVDVVLLLGFRSS